MTIAERILASRPRVAGQLLALAAQATGSARRGASRAADTAEAVRAPLAALGQALQDLNALSARYAGRMLEQNAAASQAALADAARRLRQLARSPDLVSAWQQQQQSLPALRDRFGTDLRATLNIVAEGGRELADLALETYEWLAKPAKPLPKARAKTRRGPRRTARKAARKARTSA